MMRSASLTHFPLEPERPFACDGCGTSPIIGPRYRCASCIDYDLCANCEIAKKVTKQHSPDHGMCKMEIEEMSEAELRDLGLSPADAAAFQAEDRELVAKIRGIVDSNVEAIEAQGDNLEQEVLGLLQEMARDEEHTPVRIKLAQSFAVRQDLLTPETLKQTLKTDLTDLVRDLDLDKEWNDYSGSVIEFLLSRVQLAQDVDVNADEFASLCEASDRFFTSRRNLLYVGTQALQLFQKQPVGVGSGLQKSLKQQLLQVLSQLKEGSCATMFFGETNSGKSLLLNLTVFDGEKILPSSQTPATSAIVVIQDPQQVGDAELNGSPSVLLQRLVRDEPANPQVVAKQGVVKKMVDVGRAMGVFNAAPAEEKKRPELTPIIQHSKVQRAAYHKLPQFDVQVSYESHLQAYVEATDRKDPPWDVARFLWPHSALLRAGCTVVDTPGLGENDFLDAQVTRMLPQAAGVICAINALIAVPEAVMKLIRELKRLQGQTFNSSSIFFVLTQLDRVEAKERTKVKDNIINILKKEMGEHWNEEYFVSANLLAAQKHLKLLGYRSAAHNELVGKLVRFMKMCFQSLLLRVYQVLVEVLRLMENDVNVVLRLSLGTEDERMAEIKQAQDAVRLLDTHLDSGTKILLGKSKARMLEFSREFAMHLDKDAVKFRLDHFIDTLTFPRGQKNTRLTVEAARTHVLEALIGEYTKILIEHADRTSLIVKYQKIFVNDAAESFGPLMENLESAERRLVGPRYVGPQSYEDLHPKLQKTKSVLERCLIHSLTVTLSIPLAAAFSVIGVALIPVTGVYCLGELISKKYQQHKNQKEMERDPVAFKREIAAAFYSAITDRDGEMLDNLIKQRVFNVFEMFPRFIVYLKLRRRHFEAQMALAVSKRGTAKTERASLIAFRSQLDLTLSGLAGFYLTQLRMNWVFDKSDFVENSWERKGKGGFSEVFQVQVHPKAFCKFPKLKHSAAISVAVKRILEMPGGNGVDWLAFMREERNYQQLRHAHVVEFFGSFMHNGQLHFVMEYAEFGSLRKKIEEDRKSQQQISITAVVEYAQQIAEAMQFIHQQQIMHRDLKLDNVLAFAVGNNPNGCYNAKVTDFGLSKQTTELTFTACGTPTHLAPEVAMNHTYDYSVDIYSYGIVLWEIFHGTDVYTPAQLAPYHNSQGAFLQAVHEGILRPLISVNVPKAYKELMTQCWDSTPAKRPQWGEILKRLEDIRANHN